jgi:hypothetical protein
MTCSNRCNHVHRIVRRSFCRHLQAGRAGGH